MREGLIALHLYNFIEILTFGSLTFVWGARLVVLRRPLSDGFRAALFITAGMGLIEAAIGGILFLSGCRPSDNLHLVYGLIVLVGIPVAFTYTSEKMTRRDMAVLVFAVFAVVAAALRAFATGAGGVCPP